MSVNAVSSYFQEDHEKLDGLFDQFQALRACDYAEAKRYFKDFKFGLERHIAWEEQILFPLFEAKTRSKESGPTAVMRFEHKQIKEKLERLHAKVREESPDSDEEESELLYLLAQHNKKEENILYPMIDQITSEEERKHIFHEMEQLSMKGSSGSCCDIGL